MTLSKDNKQHIEYVLCVLLGVGGWPLAYEERMCWANCPCN